MLATSGRVKVFRQPGCRGCRKAKEFLARHGVDFEPIEP
ncbi:MAG: glutaredoxin domain-containing protein [Pseudomonadota bacterium]